MSLDIGGSLKTVGKGGNNSANKKKSGSTSVRNYNPKTTTAGGGGSVKVTGMYSPIGNDTPSAVPGLKK